MYALEWDEALSKFYVDNQRIRSCAATNVIPEPMFVYLSHFVDTWGGDGSQPQYPVEFEIDCFRAYRKDPVYFDL